MTLNLFEDAIEPTEQPIAEGAVVLRAFANWNNETAIFGAIDEIVAAAPFRHMVTPGGFRMSVAMTNCGPLGWVSDKTGYRYDAPDPVSGLKWPPMPEPFPRLATAAASEAGFPGFGPDACLIN